MAIKEHFEGKRDLGLIDPRKLTTDPEYNVRDLEKPDAREELDYLKSLIRVTGVQTPLRIREDDAGKLIIVRGHRRHKVVMELIAEGHDIKLIPVTQEPRGTKPDERNWDLIDSNSEAPLKGFERAEVLYRQIHTFGWSEEKILERTGKTKQWLNAQLDLRAMPEPIKEHVRAGDISPTLARNIAKGVDPVEAEKMIKANLEQNARIKGKRTRVTAGTLKRDRPKADPKPAPFVAEDETAATQGKTAAADVPPTPPAPDLHPQLQTIMERERGPSMTAVLKEVEAITPARTFPPEVMQPPTPAHLVDRDMLAIMARLSVIAEENCLNERADDELIGVPVKLIQDADRIYRQRIGDTSEAA